MPCLNCCDTKSMSLSLVCLFFRLFTRQATPTTIEFIYKGSEWRQFGEACAACASQIKNKAVHLQDKKLAEWGSFFFYPMRSHLTLKWQDGKKLSVLAVMDYPPERKPEDKCWGGESKSSLFTSSDCFLCNAFVVALECNHSAFPLVYSHLQFADLSVYGNRSETN